MSRLLIDPSLPFGPKFVGAPAGTIELHFVALCNSALTLSDGFVPASRVYTFIKARKSEVDRMIKHLTTVQPGCANASWEERPGGWFLHDYDDPIYANPLREVVAKLQQTRMKAAAIGGKRSAAVRLERYGSAAPLRAVDKSPTDTPPSSAPEANHEAPSEALASHAHEAKHEALASQNEKPPTKQNAKHPVEVPPNLPALRNTYTDVHGDHKYVLEKHGDVVTEVPTSNGLSPDTQAVKLLDWLLINRGSGSFATRDEQQQEHAVAVQMVSLGLPLPDLLTRLQGYHDAADPDDIASSLKYYWQRLEDDTHLALKQQSRPHARTSGLSRISPSVPSAPSSRS